MTSQQFLPNTRTYRSKPQDDRSFDGKHQEVGRSEGRLWRVWAEGRLGPEAQSRWRATRPGMFGDRPAPLQSAPQSAPRRSPTPPRARLVRGRERARGTAPTSTPPLLPFHSRGTRSKLTGSECQDVSLEHVRVPVYAPPPAPALYREPSPPHCTGWRFSLRQRASLGRGPALRLLL